MIKSINHLYINNQRIFEHVREQLKGFTEIGNRPIIIEALRSDSVNAYLDAENADRSPSILFFNYENLKPLYKNCICVSKTEDNRFTTSLGYQRHISNSGNDSNISLGQLRNLQHEIEPRLRSCEHIHFNLNAIRRSDAPNNTTSSSTGLTVAEACQIMRYAGEATSAKMFTMNCDIATPNTDDIEWNVLATLIWYYQEGLSRPRHHPSSGENYKSFLIESTEIDYTLEFMKSEIDDKWWLKLPEEKYLPVSYEDYQRAINSDISNRIISHF